MNKTEKQIQQKMADYQRFGFILLAVSTFFYIGLVLPDQTKTTMESITLGTASLTGLTVTTWMYTIVRKCKMQLKELSK